MKVVYIIDSLSPDGTQRFLTHLVRGLKPLGYEQAVIALNTVADRRIEKELASAGCDVTHIGKLSLLCGGLGWWRLVKLMRRSGADIVVTLLDFADTLGRPAARQAGCRCVLSSIRVRNLSKPKWQRWLDRKTIGWASRVIFNTDAIVPYAVEREGVDTSQIVVIPNGVDDLRERSGAARVPYRQQMGLAPNDLLLGVVARLRPQKNVALVLQAAAKLPPQMPWKIAIIGDGPARTELMSLGRELQLDSRLNWLGSRPDVEQWLGAMDIFVHTSDFEGMPNAVMEAMAAGLPVVASAVDGTIDLIRDGVSGFLAPAGDAAFFARRISELMNDRDLARRMGEQAHREVLERFSLSAMIHSYHSLFSSLVGDTA